MNKIAKAILVALFTVLPLAHSTAPTANALPQGFKKATIASGFNQPTGFAVAPDGRIFVLEKAGTVKIIKNGSVLSTPFLTVPAASQGERGLLGIAFDPSFSSNSYVYFYYVNANPLEIRVSRFTASGDTAVAGSEFVLLRSTQPLTEEHHSGTLRFGPDGKLWITVGNNEQNTNSQTLSNIHGKILRINKDGTIPSDNPFVGNSGAEKSIWAFGFRNPFRFNFLPDGRPIVADVGEQTFEEVNEVVKGGNYGWPNAEGICSGCPYINPVFAYPHNGKSASITGGFVYKNNNYRLPFPGSYNNSYFYGDYAIGFIRYLQLGANGDVISDNAFDDAAGSVVDFAPASDGSLLFLTIFPGVMYKISYTTTDLAPTAVMTANPQGGLAPLVVRFSSNGSSDPQGKRLRFKWTFGDGATSTNTNPKHTYKKNGKFTATLTVSNGTFKSPTVSTTIVVGSTFPEPVITSPAAANKYNAGQTIFYSGTATDREDSTLPDSAFSWTVIFHHQTHTHPFLGPVSGKSGSIVIPDTGESSADTYYELQLTVTDSSGLSKTVTTNIVPNTVFLTVKTEPNPELSFTLDGIPQTATFSAKAVVGFKRTLDVPSPQTAGDKSYDFKSWSDNGAKSHQIITPSVNTTYTATFNELAAGVGRIHFRVRETDASGVPTGRYVNGATAKLTDTSGSVVFATYTSAPIGDQDGWVMFDNIPAGSYGVLAYKKSFKGMWKQTSCTTGPGSTTGATIQNQNTENVLAGWQSPVTVTASTTPVWCKDIGLFPADKGNLYVRTMLVERDTQIFHNPPSVYNAIKGVNGATVKLTDITGATVVKTTTSQIPPWGGDGWIVLDAIPEGKYGLMAYKTGYVGFWRLTSCSTSAINSSIENQNTQGLVAGWNSPVTITGGLTTNCYDVGFLGYGTLSFRVREVDTNGNQTGRFVNDATVKLTDPTGQLVYATSTSQAQNQQDGWVTFNHVEAGNYSVLAYKTGFTGQWKQTDCSGTGTIQNATITNTNTEGLTAAWQNNFHIGDNENVACKDLGLTTTQAARTAQTTQTPQPAVDQPLTQTPTQAGQTNTPSATLTPTQTVTPTPRHTITPTPTPPQLTPAPTLIPTPTL